MDVAGLLLLDDELVQSVWRNQSKDISSNTGQSSVDILSVLLIKNPKYGRLAHQTLLQDVTRIFDTYVRPVKKNYSCCVTLIMRYFVEIPLDGYKSQAPRHTP